MSTLIIKKAHKSYRFTMEAGHIMVGHSRKADLRLSKTEALQIEGIFESTEQGWCYHSFSLTAKDQDLVIPLSKKTTIRIGEITLETEVITERSRFSTENKMNAGDLSKLTRQVVLVYLRGKIAASFADVPNRKATFMVYGQALELQTVATPNWIESQHGDFTLKQKSVADTDLQAFALPLKSLLPTQGKDQWIGGAIGLTLLLALTASFFGPAQQEFVSQNEAPKITAPVLVRVSPPKQVQASMKEASAETTPGKASNSMDRIKNLTASISSKAGAFIAKANRLPAAIGPNGNVNAAALGVARFGGSTTDWNAMAGSKVSGKVGGSLSGGTGGGQLAAGGTGASGVGLLEQEGEVSTGLDRELIAALIRKNIGHILYCYERSLSANPNLFGKVSVRFIIGSSGKVETQKIGESTLRDGRVEHCILDKVSQWKFPEPKGGVQVVVTYPFLFKTTN